nr:DUF4339 domain-containing protein [Planctomycetota bacterium]
SAALAELIREGRIRESTLVRREWPSDWQRADTVAGLFRAARLLHEVLVTDRSAAAVPREPETAEGQLRPSRRNHGLGWFACLVGFPFGRRAEVWRPAEVGAMHAPGRNRGPRILDLGEAEDVGKAAGRLCPAAVIPIGDRGEPPSTVPAAVADEWSETVSAAMRAAEARDASCRRDRASNRSASLPSVLLYRLGGAIRRAAAFLPAVLFTRRADGRDLRRRDRVARWLAALERRLPPPHVLRPGFRFGAAAAGANLTAFGLLNWSDRQTLRFPGRDTDGTPPVFPFYGECSDVEYVLLLGHAVLLVAAAAYVAAWRLEAHAED